MQDGDAGGEGMKEEVKEEVIGKVRQACCVLHVLQRLMYSHAQTCYSSACHQMQIKTPLHVQGPMSLSHGDRDGD